MRSEPLLRQSRSLGCQQAERIEATTEKLHAFGVELIAPCHCTGFEATGSLQNQFGSRVVALRARLTVQVPEA